MDKKRGEEEKSNLKPTTERKIEQKKILIPTIISDYKMQ